MSTKRIKQTNNKTKKTTSTEYVVAIPSYKRAQVLAKKSLKTLIDGKVSPSKIHIFVADKAEEREYLEHVPKTMYGKIIVGKLGITNQRNFIKNFFPLNQRIVSIDDDVEGLYRMKSAEKLEKIGNVDKFYKEAFAKLDKEHLFMWGIYPVRNPFFMKNTVTTGLKFIIGAMHGYINRKLKELEPSTSADQKEDYEQSILYYKKDGGVVRYNNVTIKTKFKAEGGLGIEETRMEANKKAAEYLKKQYPDLITIFHRKNGMTEVRLARKNQLIK